MAERKKPDPSHSNDRQPAHFGVKGIVRIKLVIIITLALLAVVTTTVVLFQRHRTNSQEGQPVPAPIGELVPLPSAGVASNADEITLSLSPDQIANAQIKTEIAITQTGPDQTITGE